MRSNPHHNTIEELFEMFGMVSQRELIALQKYLAEEHVRALEAADVTQAATIETLYERTSRLIQRIEANKCPQLRYRSSGRNSKAIDQD